MYSPSSSHRRTRRLAWEWDTDFLASDARTSPQEAARLHLGVATSAQPPFNAEATFSGQVLNSGRNSHSAEAHCQRPPLTRSPPQPHRDHNASSRNSKGKNSKHSDSFFAHDNCTFSARGCFDTDGSFDDSRARFECSSQQSGSTFSSVSIVLDAANAPGGILGQSNCRPSNHVASPVAATDVTAARSILATTIPAESNTKNAAHGVTPTRVHRQEPLKASLTVTESVTDAAIDTAPSSWGSGGDMQILDEDLSRSADTNLDGNVGGSSRKDSGGRGSRSMNRLSRRSDRLDKRIGDSSSSSSGGTSSRAGDDGSKEDGAGGSSSSIRGGADQCGSAASPAAGPATETTVPKRPTLTSLSHATCAAVPSRDVPKRVQLSISCVSLPTPAAPLSPQSGAPVPVGSSAQDTEGCVPCIMRYQLADAAVEPSGIVYARALGKSTVAVARPSTSPPPPAGAHAARVPSSGHPLHRVTSVASSASASEAVAEERVILIPEADGDLHDVDVVANIAVAANLERSTTAAAAGPGMEAAAAAGATAATADSCTEVDTLPAEVRRRLNSHLGRKRAKSIRNWKDLSHSMARQPPGYWLLGTMLLLVIMMVVFFFMAGQYEFVRPMDVSTSSQQTVGGEATALLSGDSLSNQSWGPDSLVAWLVFWRSSTLRTFNFEYLRLWGGRYSPDLLAGQWWRWLSSLLVHQSCMHLAANTALLLVLSAYLESLFGCWRILPVWVVAGVAGNLVSAFFENPCMLVVGSSGAVFGLLGAYVADAALNFESIPMLWLRLVGMAAVAALLVALQATGHSGGPSRGSSTSHASHIGGFLAGGMLAVLLVPDFKSNRSRKVADLMKALGVGHELPEPSSTGGRQLYSFWQRNKAALYGLYSIAILMLLMILMVLPLVIYLRTFRKMVCA